MYTYRVYNFIIGSDVEFPELVPEEGQPSAWIRMRPLTKTDVIAFHDGGEHIGSGVDGFILFQVSEGREIVASIEEGADVGEARAAILGGILATLLRQRGLLVLHACAVAKDGEAVAFVGDSGWGKSTLAEYFCQNGYRLINDDVVALDLSGDRIQVVPGYPQIKLREEAGSWLRKDYDRLSPISDRGDKRGSNWLEMFQSDPLPLRRMYFLEQYAADDTGVEAITVQQAIRELIMHTRVNHLITAPSYRAMHLQQCSKLLASIPVAWLHRKKSLEALAEVRELVESDQVMA